MRNFIILTVPQNPTWEATEHAGQNVQLENMHQTINGNSPHIYTNGASPVQSYVQAAIDVSAHARRFDVSPSMLLSQSSNLGMMQGPNDGMIKSVGYSGDSCFLYGSDSNVLEARPGIGDPSVPPFSNVGSNSQALNGNGLGADTSSFGFLGQIPRNFSLSDLTADFTNSSGLCLSSLLD